MQIPRPWPAEDPRRLPVTLRREYLASGYTDRAIDTMVRDGTLARVRRGAYVAGDVWRNLDDNGRHSLRARAVQKQACTQVVLSHVTGLLEFDSPTWGLDLSEVHVTRRDGRAGRREAGVHQHVGLIADGDVVLHNGVHVMRPDRLALEVATSTDVEHALPVLCDLLHRKIITGAELTERHRTMVFWPRSLGSEVAVRLADPRIESVGEARTWHLCFAQGLPMPEPQYEIVDRWGRVLARVDFAWPELGVFVEFDGRIKYEKLLRDGERPSDVVVREKEREKLICRLTGWRCVRLTWADLEHPARTAAMIRAEFSRPAA